MTAWRTHRRRDVLLGLLVVASSVTGIGMAGPATGQPADTAEFRSRLVDSSEFDEATASCIVDGLAGTLTPDQFDRLVTFQQLGPESGEGIGRAVFDCVRDRL